MLIKDRSYYVLEKNLRLLALCGVPIPYLQKQMQIHQFNFAPTSIQYSNETSTVISADYQYNFLLDFFKNIQYIGDPSTYVIGSFPTDQAAYQLAALITITYYEYARKEKVYPQIKWIDLGSPDFDFLKSDENVSLLVIHGLSENSSENRKLELAKDFLRRGSNSTRIILSVSPNILTYAIKHIEITPDAVFQLLRTINRIVV